MALLWEQECLGKESASEKYSSMVDADGKALTGLTDFNNEW